jgi:hypothetical protein
VVRNLRSTATPYTFVATVIRRGEEVEIIAATEQTYPSYSRDILRSLKT